MKNTHEQAFNDKNKTIHLCQSIIREQEGELEELRKLTNSEGMLKTRNYRSQQERKLGKIFLVCL